MSLQFILGRANTAKQSHIQNLMENIVETDQGQRVFYLVPDHLKFESELEVLKRQKERYQTKYAGMIRLQVFSFTRLAWYFLQGKETMNKTQLTDTGLTMLIRKIVSEKEEQLTIFRGESHFDGFIEKLSTLFMEFRNGKLSPEDLEIFIENASNESLDYQYKLRDLHILFTAYLDRLTGEYVEREDLLQALIDEVEQRDMTNTTIFINHFESFSAQEQDLILELVKQAKDVKVSLTLDQKFTDSTPELTNLFYEPGVTYHKLYQSARENHLPVLFDDKVAERNSQISKSIHQLENYWVKSQQLSSTTNDSKTPIENSSLEVWEATSKQAEILHVANRINKLVVEDNYRYNDFLIVSRNIDEYKTIFDPYFNRANIPFFIDEPDTMSHHPLVELIQSLLLIVKRNYRYEDVMRLLKTELLVPEFDDYNETEESALSYQKALSEWREKVDVAENVILAYGYEGRNAFRDEDWIYARFNNLNEEDSQSDYDKKIQNTANEVRRFINRTIQPFYEELTTEVNNNTEAVQLIYNFLDTFGVKNQLLFWREQAIENGALEEARKHEQVWKTWVDLLDEFVELIGDESWDLDSFLTIIETGFENATYSIVLPSIDQVVITNFDKSRIGLKKIVFYIGMNDTSLPFYSENDSLLTDEDRQQIENQLSFDQFLTPITKEIMAGEPFTAYQAFLFGSERLIFTYSQKNDGNSDNGMSPYIKRITEYFEIPIQGIQSHIPVKGNKIGNIDLEMIGSRSQTIGQIISVIRDSIDLQLTPSEFWLSLYKNIRDQSNPVENKIFKSLTHKNIPTPLNKELAEDLYGKDLNLSVSQLESFYLDPYSHFLLYGLKLEERKRQELTPLETGNFFHESLDLIVNEILKRQLDIETISDKKLEEISVSIFNEILSRDVFKILVSSNQMSFIKDQLIDTVKQRIKALQTQVKFSKMKPSKTEVQFGRLGAQNGISGMEFPLNSGGKLYLRGKIDRIDQAQIEGEHYLSVIDYKSGSKKFDFSEIYQGLMMQMLTYLDTALTYSDELFEGIQFKPGAMLYSQIRNPKLKDEKVIGKDLIEMMLKEFKYRGIVIGDAELLQALDLSIEEGQSKSSAIYPIYQKNDGSFSKSNSIMSMDDLRLLIKHNRELIQKAGNEILNGYLYLSPFYDKKRFTPSVGGEYHAISQFDPLLEENNYRDLDKLNKDNLVELLAKKFNERKEDKR